ncbi:MAG: hypothetical protein CL570_01585 [Alphaproteobacteria bacterium]|nr:hypothetical protein [Alphaproteobacteria bacterium]|tara:strand:+ start:25185 stop:26354 length:1170 start_codon:yes stop_codon:yes gene_type:complete
MSLFGDEMPETDALLLDDSDALQAGSDNHLRPAREMQFCLAHDAQEQQCLKMLAEGKMPHALLLTGVKGIGKATFAHRLAKHLLANDAAKPDPNQDALFGDDAPAAAPQNMDVSPDNKAVRLYLNGAHPDCKTVERAYDDAKNKYKDAVDVGEIRKIAPFLRMAASDGGWRIVIIDDADTMNRSAQNALLKVLEEPPKKTLIILVAHRPGRLIATIHSRVQRIAFSPLSSDDLHQLLNMAEDKPDDTQIVPLISMAQGSIGQALELWEQGGIDSLATVVDLLATYPRFDWVSLHKKIDPLTRAGQDQAYRLFQAILCRIFCDMTSAKARGNALPEYLQGHAAATKIQTEKSLQNLVSLSGALQDHFDRSNFANLDKKQTLLHAISLIAA